VDLDQGEDIKEKNNFPAKLYRLLEDPASQEYIAWLPHGRSWKILKQHEFEENIIPLFFRHAKLSSFMRQVNGWGFRRTTSGPEPNAYHHEMFLRGHPRLCAEMRRPPYKLQTKPRGAGGRPNVHELVRFMYPSVEPGNTHAVESVHDAKVSASAVKRMRKGSRNIKDDVDTNSDTDGDSHDDSDSDLFS
jgi:hypothetical protein